MRKYLLNGTLLSAIAGGWGTFQATRNGPRDWRLILMWISWGLAVAIAVGTIVKDVNGSDELES
ncbi:MAG: hypothetical protein ACOH1K_04815 [Rhodoglobus sp.]